MRLRHLLGPLPDPGVSALVTALFLLFFLGLCWFVYRRERRALYSRLEKMPLDGGE